MTTFADALVALVFVWTLIVPLFAYLAPWNRR